MMTKKSFERLAFSVILGMGSFFGIMGATILLITYWWSLYFIGVIILSAAWYIYLKEKDESCR